MDNTPYDKEKSPEAGRKSDPKAGGGYAEVKLVDGEAARPWQLERVPGQRFRFNYDYCRGCGLCVAECPCGAIRMVPE